MPNWKEMSRYDHDRMWAFVEKSLRFRPQNCNTIVAPVMRSRMIDISSHYIGRKKAQKKQDLLQNFLKVFRSLTSPAEYIFALDWENDSYVFSAYEGMETDESGDWHISPMPSGHFIFFITSDKRNAYCADGVNMRIYLIGEALIRQFKVHEPELFIQR